MISSLIFNYFLGGGAVKVCFIEYLLTPRLKRKRPGNQNTFYLLMIVIYNHLVLGHKNPIGNFFTFIYGFEKKLSPHKSREMLLKRSK